MGLRRLAAIVAAAAVVTLPTPARAAVAPVGSLTSVGALATDETSEYQGWSWASPDEVFEYVTPQGRLAVVRHDPAGNRLTVDGYDPATLQPSGPIAAVDLSGWPDWGGFYAGPDGYFYVLVGQDNPTESNDLDVVALRRYDASWTLVGTAYLKGGAFGGSHGIYAPFDAGHPHMVLVGGRLVVHMSRLLYAIGGVHHQANLTFEVDTATMTAATFEDLGGYAYVSHSFQQLVAVNGTSLVTVDHGDAYPRAIQLAVTPGYPGSRATTTYDLLDFPGEIGDNVTGATVNALVSGSRGVVVLGSSVRVPGGRPKESRNVFAITADPATGAHALHWLTSFAPKGTGTAGEPRTVAIGGDRFVVLFEVVDAGARRLEYRLIDSAANVLASASFPNVGYASIADPVVLGTRVYWVGNRGSQGYLFGLDVANPTRPGLPAGAVSPKPIRKVKKPKVTGRFRVGSKLVATSSWRPKKVAISYQWLRDSSVITRATKATYKVRKKDRGHSIQVRVTVTKEGYAARTAFSLPHRVSR